MTIDKKGRGNRHHNGEAARLNLRNWLTKHTGHESERQRSGDDQRNGKKQAHKGKGYRFHGSGFLVLVWSNPWPRPRSLLRHGQTHCRLIRGHDERDQKPSDFAGTEPCVRLVAEPADEEEEPGSGAPHLVDPRRLILPDDAQASGEGQHLGIPGVALAVLDAEHGVVRDTRFASQATDGPLPSRQFGDDLGQKVCFCTHTPNLRHRCPNAQGVHALHLDLLPLESTPMRGHTCLMTAALDVLAKNLKWLMENTPDLQSQAQVAQRSGMDQKTVSRILNQQHSPNLEKVEALANAFGIQLTELLSPHPSWSDQRAAEDRALLLSDQEKDLILSFRDIPEDDQQSMLTDALSRAEKSRAHVDKIMRERFRVTGYVTPQRAAEKLPPAPPLDPSRVTRVIRSHGGAHIAGNKKQRSGEK